MSVLSSLGARFPEKIRSQIFWVQLCARWVAHQGQPLQFIQHQQGGVKFAEQIYPNNLCSICVVYGCRF